MHVERCLVVAVGERPAPLAFVEVCQGKAYGIISKTKVCLAGVVVTEVFAVLLIEERPLVTGLLCLPDKAVALGVKVTVVHKINIVARVVPVDGREAVLVGGHGLDLHLVAIGAAVAAGLIVELAAVAHYVVVGSLLNLTEAGDVSVLGQVNRLTIDLQPLAIGQYG